MHALDEEGVAPIQARLVERLGHSPQAVSEMVKRLVEDGYIARSGRDVALTEKGRTRAESVVRRHRLAERFLVDILGLPWDQAHIEAGRWEHVISDNVEERFVELLGHPTTCPHGNPIPGTIDDPTPQFPVAEAAQGSHVRLARITERIETDSAALSYLDTHGLIPGQGARVADRAPDGTITLVLDGKGNVAVGPMMGRDLYVTVG